MEERNRTLRASVHAILVLLGVDGSLVRKRFACAGSPTVETEPEGRAALKKGRVELDF